MIKRARLANAFRRIGLSEIALIIAAPLTMILVVFTLFHTPLPPLSAGVGMGSGVTVQPIAKPSASATTSAAAGRQIAAFLGDSYAFGTGASGASKRWTDIVSAHMGWIEKNLSPQNANYTTSGQPAGTSYGARMEAVAATGAQIVVVSGGRNDVGIAPTQFRADVRATFAAIHVALPKAKIIVLSPIWGNDPVPARLTSLIFIVQAEAKRAGITYLDIGEPMLGHSSMLGVDGWHPNDAGYAAIAVSVDKALT